MTDLISLAAKGVQGLQPYQPGKPVSELQRELGLGDILKLASNENPLGCSDKASAALVDVAKNLADYPDGNSYEIKQAIAAYHGVDIGQVTVGNGSNDILELIARAYLTPETAAVYSKHAFAVYPIVTQAIGAEHRVAEAQPADAEQPYGHDLDKMLALIDDQVRVVFVANPNNPTGGWLGEAELTRFLDAVPATTVVVLDEAYFDYVGEADYPDGAKLLSRYPNLVVTRTFSKAYGLAALRLGYALSSPQLADVMNRVRQPFNVNAAAQAAGIAALADRQHIAYSKAVNDAGLQQWQQACERMNWTMIPSVGNFVCLDLGQPAMPVYDAMLAMGVIVRPVENYGLPGMIRITVGKNAQNERAIAALQMALEQVA